jgi:hypothetical protein
LRDDEEEESSILMVMIEIYCLFKRKEKKKTQIYQYIQGRCARKG